MRIITGILKGRNLSVPGNTEIRPTTDRVKEGLFSVMESRRYIQNCTVLDLFAGSGNLGFEALSRGAKSALFVDQDQKSTNYIQNKAQEFGVADQASTVMIDVAYYLQGPAVPFDIIFADPPYVYRGVEDIVASLMDNNWLADDGWLIVEHNKYHDFREHDHFLFQKKYGRTFVSFLQGAPTVSTDD